MVEIHGVKLRNNKLYSYVNNEWIHIEINDISYDTKDLSNYIINLKETLKSLTSSMLDTHSGKRLNPIEEEYKNISESETEISQFKSDQGEKIIRVKNPSVLQSSFLDIYNEDDEEKLFAHETNAVNGYQRETKKPKKINIINEKVSELTLKQKENKQIIKDKPMEINTEGFLKVMQIKKGRLSIADSVIFFNKKRRFNDSLIIRSKALNTVLKKSKKLKKIKVFVRGEITDSIKIIEQSDKEEKRESPFKEKVSKQKKKEKKQAEKKIEENIERISSDNFVTDDIFEEYKIDEDMVGFGSHFMETEEED